ncbi:hypothetical protein BH23CHL6_BH23CHL6_03610 [soil metagenome]
MRRELELKYSVGDADALLAWLDDHLPPAPGATGWQDTMVIDRYFDTAGRALGAAGYGARLRQRSGETIVGLKSDIGVSDGIHYRHELEAPATPALVPGDWPPSDVRELVQRVAGTQPLIERFVLDQLRREREHALDDCRFLISMDHVNVLHRGRRLGELHQLEVELLDGNPSVLAALGRRIAASGLVRPELRSKLATAKALAAAADTPR